MGRENLDFDRHKLSEITFGVIAQYGQNISLHRQPIDAPEPRVE
jgi:hypothetical protein